MVNIALLIPFIGVAGTLSVYSNRVKRAVEKKEAVRADYQRWIFSENALPEIRPN